MKYYETISPENHILLNGFKLSMILFKFDQGSPGLLLASYAFQLFFSCRHVTDDAIDDYKIIMLNKRYLSFRVIKVSYYLRSARGCLDYDNHSQ